MASLNKGQRFRFGNHPIRQKELIREYGSKVQLVGELYLKRNDAKEAASILNCGCPDLHMLQISMLNRDDICRPFLKADPGRVRLEKARERKRFIGCGPAECPGPGPAPGGCPLPRSPGRFRPRGSDSRIPGRATAPAIRRPPAFPPPGR